MAAVGRSRRLMPRQAAAAPAIDPGPRPSLRWIRIEFLDVDHRYQRPLTPAHVARIRKGFTWLTFQPVTVTRVAADRFAVLDGQHRVEAARAMPGIDSVPCYVVAAADLATQARVFLGVNQARLGVTSISLYHAAVAAGDPVACTVARLLAAAGVGVPALQMSAVAPMQTAAVVVLRKAVQAWGERAVGTALAALAEAHPATPAAFGASLLAGLARLFGDAAPPARNAVAGVLAGLDLPAFVSACRVERRETHRRIDAIIADRLRAALAQSATTGRAAARPDVDGEGHGQAPGPGVATVDDQGVATVDDQGVATT